MKLSALEPGELLVDPALELRVERGRWSGGPRRRLHRRTSRTTAIAPATSAPSGRSQARSPKPLFGGVASTPGPNSATSASLISCSVSPAAIRSRMNAFMRCATGASDWSSVVSQTGQTSSASRSAAFGGPAACRRRRSDERARENERREKRASRLERAVHGGTQTRL